MRCLQRSSVPVLSLLGVLEQGAQPLDLGLVDFVIGNLLHHVGPLAHRETLDERLQRDLPIRDQLERFGIELGLASPGTLDRGIERHQVAQTDFRLGQREADHHER